MPKSFVSAESGCQFGVMGRHASKELRLGLSPASVTLLLGAVVFLAVLGILRTLWPVHASPTPKATETVVEQTGVEEQGRTETAGRSLSASKPMSEMDREGSSATHIWVYLTGAVVEPGVLSVPAGSRLEVVVAAAGGFHADADWTSVNLARLVEDGEHVHVAVVGEDVSPALAGPEQPPGAGSEVIKGCVDLNHATLEELQTLDGVGPVLGSRILDHREAVGAFSTNEDLLAVTGIGAKLFSRIEVGLCPG